MSKEVAFKFAPLQKVIIDPLRCNGRINRCIYDGGSQPIYAVDYYMDGEPRQSQFYEDEIVE